MIFQIFHPPDRQLLDLIQFAQVCLQLWSVLDNADMYSTKEDSHLLCLRPLFFSG